MNASSRYDWSCASHGIGEECAYCEAATLAAEAEESDTDLDLSTEIEWLDEAVEADMACYSRDGELCVGAGEAHAREVDLSDAIALLRRRLAASIRIGGRS